MRKRVLVKRPGFLQALKSDTGKRRESECAMRYMFGILLDFRCQRKTKKLEEDRMKSEQPKKTCA